MPRSLSTFRSADGATFSQTALGSWRRRKLAGKRQSEDQADERQGSYNEHRDREACVVGEEPENGRAQTPEADREPHRDAGGQPYAAGQILLPHDDGYAERAHGNRAHEREDHHPHHRAREREAVDERGQQEHGDAHDPAAPEPVGEGSHDEGSYGPTEEHHGEGGVAERGRGPEHALVVGGHEGDEPEVDEGAHGHYPDHPRELPPVLRRPDRLGAPVIRLPRAEADHTRELREEHDRHRRRGEREEERAGQAEGQDERGGDRKSTRLNSSHANISYAVFCLKKKKK